MKRRADGGRKRMALVESDQALVKDAPLMKDGQKLGHIVSAYGMQGLAVIRQDRINEPSALIDGQSVGLRFFC